MKRRVSIAILALLAAAGLAQWCGLTNVRTPAERVAIERMRAPPLPALGQRNAFAALWFARFEMPEERLAETLEQDVAQWRALFEIEDPVSRRQGRWRFRSAAEDRYPKLPTAFGEPVLCFAWIVDCLARTRDDTEAARAVVARVAAYLPRLERLGQYDHVSNPFRRYGPGRTPAFGTLFGVLLSDAALRHVDGELAPEARLCAVSATLRRLRAHSDDLATTSAFQSVLAAAARLYADLRAERPPGPELPDCLGAFAPLADAELDLCPAFRREYLIEHESPDTLVMSGPEGPGLFERIGWALFDYRADHPGWARLLTTTYCSPERAGRNRERARLDVDEGLLLCNAGERLFHPAQCASLEVAMPRFADAHDAQLDLDARLTTLTLARELAALPRAAREDAFDRRARAPIERSHPIALAHDVLTAPLLLPRFEPGVRTPVPGTRAAPAQPPGPGRR